MPFDRLCLERLDLTRAILETRCLALQSKLCFETHCIF